MPLEEIKLNIKRPEINYSIFIEDGILGKIKNYLPNASKYFLLTHKHLYDLYGEKIITPLQNVLGVKTHFLPDGEKAKSWDNSREILESMLHFQMDRKAVVIALGGGVIGDMAGFVSSIYQRGVDFIQIPTSLLAMVDSSVGGKTAVNLGGYGKNLIGAFHQPKLVLIDPLVLDSLPELEWKNGLAEILKYSFLREDNGEFYEYLDNAPQPSKGGALKEFIQVSVQTKADIVKQDETEKTGKRALLNLGHTFGHVLETASEYQISHGLAVSIGIRLAAELSFKLKLINLEVKNKIIDLLKKYDLPIKIPTINKTQGDFQSEKLIDLFMHDKKVENNKINFVLPVGHLSHCEVVEFNDKEVLKEILSLCF